MPDHTNSLIHEKSPYLLQHAHNPVEWRAWNDETLALAKAEDKPLFVSIGYSTCHWCHVMERESFENPDVADVMNRYFINVKVDREERPDVDHRFMLAVQAMGQQGGWPLSVWLTPDLEPFYGGTYFPPTSAFGRPGFVDVLHRIHELWTTYPDGFRSQAAKVAAALDGLGAANAAERPEIGEFTLDAGYAAFDGLFDHQNGGFGRAPKFPRPAGLEFLLRYHARTGDQEALGMVVQTLRSMAVGGIHDHLGGGFSRYSVDAHWGVPHFEKMLYDQAQLMSVAAHAFQLTLNGDLAGIVYDIATYVRRDLTSPEGAFYSAEDADSVDATGVSREGAFYTWTPKQTEAALGEKTARIVNAYFGVTDEGNFERGETVLSVSASTEGLSEEYGISERNVRELLSDSMEILLRTRELRRRPLLDDKILTSWNGLMISGFSHAYRAIGDEDYLQAARSASDFMLGRLWDADKRTLHRRYRDGEVAVEGFLDDHAFFAQGLLDLYEASLDVRYLAAAIDIARVMVERFWIPDTGGFLFAAGQYEHQYDGAEPAGNSVAASVLFRLAEMTGEAAWREKGAATVTAASGTFGDSPESIPAMLCALDTMITPPAQVVIAGDPKSADTLAMVRAVQARFLPTTSLLHSSAFSAAPWLAEMKVVDSKATAYVCKDFACQTPTTNLEALIAAL
ncbi:MAG TPA: thioredoxin domain-containing protein [Armatimonadota bacterium]|jgi:hypothetical protein